MSHDHEHHNPAGEIKSKTALRSSFWFMIILVGLFVAAINFVTVMGSEHEEGEGGNKPTMPTMESTSNQTSAGETGLGKPQADTTQHMQPASVGGDSMAHHDQH